MPWVGLPSGALVIVLPRYCLSDLKTRSHERSNEFIAFSPSHPHQLLPFCFRVALLSGTSGLIGLRVEGSRGALVEVNSETDFVARNAKFQEFVEKVLGVAIDKAGEADGASPAARDLDVSELLQAEQSGTLPCR